MSCTNRPVPAVQVVSLIASLPSARVRRRASRGESVTVETLAPPATVVLTEDLLSPATAETLADEVGLHTAVLRPLEGLTESQAASGDDYVSVMRRNLETLRDGLECS